MTSGSSFGSLWVPLIAVAALLSALASLRPPLQRLWGDEGTYVAMTASLARDGDLRFGEPDRVWAERREPGVGATVILQRTADGVAYSKPILYPLLAAPLYLALGERGMVMLNVAVLAAALALAWRALARRGSTELTSLTLLTYVGCGALLPYLLWRVSDLLQLALALGGLLLTCADLREGGERRAWVLLTGGALLGLLTTMRLPNAALAAAAVAAALLCRRPRRALLVAAGAAMAALLLFGGGRLLTGSANPYKAERASFNGELGYPVGRGAERAIERFDSHPATQRIGLRPELDAGRSLHSALYFLVGRHTGLLLYFPMALLLAVRIAVRPDRVGLTLAAGVGAIVLFYLVWLPTNYFGGSTFVGNRYFLVAYAGLLAAAPGLPSGRQMVPIWLLAATAGISALYSVESTGAQDSLSQTHAYGGVFRLLPYETTAQEIDGQRDRYWTGDFVRFVDPFAAVDDHSFELGSGRPPAELVIATAWSGSPLHLLVTSATTPLELHVADWGRRRWHRLGSGGNGVRRIVEIEPSPAWRHHRFWWPAERGYRVRTLRLQLLDGDGDPARPPTRARVRYLGDGSILERRADRELLSVRLPKRSRAGDFSRLRLRVRNETDWTWTSDDLVPLYLSYRLRGPDAVTVDGPRTRIEPPVEPGGVLDGRLQIAWPEAAGRYTLSVDLVVEDLYWFEDRVGEPLVEAEIEVRERRRTAR